MKEIRKWIAFLAVIHLSLQDCPEEYTRNGITVKWRKSPTAFDLESEPPCYSQDNIIKRNCTDNKWTPFAEEIGPCVKVVKFFDVNSSLVCPPGFQIVSENNTDYCYKISPSSSWNYPCFNSGGASIITDLNMNELDSLIDSLAAPNRSRYFWLPAYRQKLLHPIVWSIPGPHWKKQVKTNEHLTYINLFWKNCLALDIQQRIIITHTCTESYPSLCFYINTIHYPATCPDGYHAFRYKPDNGTCFGIETAEVGAGLTFSHFIENKCKTPMDMSSLNRFIFTKLAEFSHLPDNKWCWFKTMSINENDIDNDSNKTAKHLEGIINNVGSLGFINSSSILPCMACENPVIYSETEFMLEYNEVENKIYLTIYFPSGLWKYDYNDKGIQCFSDAKGFVRVVSIDNIPYMFIQQHLDENNHNQTIEKIVYTVDLVTERSAQYWCEGHTYNFSLLSTEKIIVNPNGKDVHVFSMILNCYNITNAAEVFPDLDGLLLTINKALDVQKLLLMDIYNLTDQYITILLHVHTTVVNIYEDEAQNILEQYHILKERAKLNLPNINCSFINLTSSVYCLPTTSNDYLTLDWELTPIGHITAPKQFCLQSNGLPVQRQCLGSYHEGGMWGPVDGRCDGNYVPSETTTFLYNIVKGQAPTNDTERFLVEGLEYVLSDVKSIIPADIYYLSMSLNKVLQMAQENETCVDIGDIQNIAWVMDRVLHLDCDYMRLAQTLNSTNVILNSVNDIIEMIATYNNNETLNLTTDEETPGYESELFENIYQLAVKPHFIVQISYPDFSNVTGIALHKVSVTDNFTEMIVQPLYANTSLGDILAIENLEVATWLPENLLKSLKYNSNETDKNRDRLHIIVSMFQNDVVFQELENLNHVINSRIVGVTIPGYLPNLKYPLPIVFKQLNPTESKQICSFWDFQSVSPHSLGLWKTKGCFKVHSTENITICECYHLTHFSQLISLQGNTEYNHNNPEMMNHTQALNTITLVGCFLSLMGVIGIWITAMVFSNWRKKPGTKVLLNLATAIALPLILIVFSNLDGSLFTKIDDGYQISDHYKPVCIVLGALLHYSILASFMWMLITAVLQFVRYVRVLGVCRPSRFMFKFALVGWGIPLIPVIIVLAIDFESYVPSISSFKPLCYPQGLNFILGLLLPICTILFVNIILFLLVINSIARGPDEKMKSTDIDLVGAQLRLSIFLFFLLGLSWIFGILSFTRSMIWSYLFCLTATLQGFVLFIYFIVCDPATRNMWIALVKPPFSSNSSRNSITSTS